MRVNYLGLFISFLVLAMSAVAPPAVAASGGDGQLMVPGIWIDPDGCEHWVMDSGFEGYMSPVRLPDGRAVCNRDPSAPRPCGVISTDSLFATGSAEIATSAVAMIENFFRGNRRQSFIVEGYTDSRASESYNLALSQHRAAAVAAIGLRLKAHIRDVRGLGEGHPRATNATAAGRALNRRVEILCVQ